MFLMLLYSSISSSTWWNHILHWGILSNSLWFCI